jgi:predicted RNase H-like HicB family nuclease
MIGMKIKLIVHKAEEGGYWAEVPAIPGCFSQGETMEELKANILEAIEGILSVDGDNQQSHSDSQVIELAI